MVKELSYSTISYVNEAWQAMKRSKDHEEAGVRLFQRLFEKAPDALPLFGFPIDTDVESPELLNSAKFKIQAASMVEMIGSALDMLGPDIELLSEILKDLGEKHARYGVTPQMFAVMGVALADMLEETVGKKVFNEDARKAFVGTFDTLSGDMVIALKDSKK